MLLLPETSIYAAIFVLCSYIRILGFGDEHFV